MEGLATHGPRDAEKPNRSEYSRPNRSEFIRSREISESMDTMEQTMTSLQYNGVYLSGLSPEP